MAKIKTIIVDKVMEAGEDFARQYVVNQLDGWLNDDGILCLDPREIGIDELREAMLAAYLESAMTTHTLTAPERSRASG